MTDYNARSQRVIFTQQELAALKAILDGGDRGGFYMTYYAMTDSTEALLQAKVATFSGMVGGAAFAANRFLQDEYGVDGTETPERYPGIYYLSQEVAVSGYDEIEASADPDEGDGTGKISDQVFFDSASDAWDDEGIVDIFPGNLLKGTLNDINSPGGVAALAATPYASYLGKRVTDFDPSRVVTISEGVKVAYDQNGQIEAVFKDTIYDLAITVAGAALPVDNSTLNHLFGGVMPTDSVSQADARVGFKESNPGFNGDIDPLQTNDHDPLEYAFSTSGTSQSDLILTPSSVDAGSGDDVIVGAAGAQELKGGAGDDVIWGREGDDTIDGGSNDDVLRGGANDDTIKGGAGNDLIDGGDINLNRASDGTDTADYSDATGGITIDFTNQTQSRLAETFVEVADDGYGGHDTLHSIEKILFSQMPDTLKVSKDALALDFKIDMGESNRQASPFNLDVYDLSNVSEGLTYRSGKVAFGWGGPLSTFVGLAENLEVKNADKIVLTDFADTVVSANFGNVIETRGGADKIWVGSNGVAIKDLSKDDRLTIAGVLPLFGGIRNGNERDDPYGYSFGGAVAWAVDESGALQVSLFGGATTYILNWEADSAGKTVDERPGHISLFTKTNVGVYRLVDGWPSNATIMGWWDFFGALVKTHFGLEVWKGVDPLTLDLDGDGLELTGVSSLSARFDFNADGYAERAGWVRPDDGILVRDLNANGRIDNVTEMFGGDASGFAELASLDGNQDGKVDVNDNGLADFNGDGTADANDTIDSLRVWRDFNENGVTETGELFSLASLDIASISVAGTAQQDLFEEGNQITATGTFTRTDASTGTIADVLYRVDNSYTQYAGDPIAITAHAAALPDHKGHGTLVSLREAMSLDDNFATAVETALPSLSALELGALRAAALPILLGWAVASPLTDGDNNPNTNPPKLIPHDDVHVLISHDEFGGESVADYAYQTSATVEGQTVSFWALGSGRAVVDGEGVTLTHPTLAQLLAAPQTLGTWTLLDGDVVSFVERYIGEQLPVDRVVPEGTAVDPATVDIFNTILSTTNLAVVRIAVQDGPLSSFFASMVYDAADNSFHPAPGNDRQLIPVFEAIFNEAIAESHGAAWLTEWKPLLDVVTGDYVRGASFLSMSYAFMAQNIVAAYESTGIGLSFNSVTAAFGLPGDLVISGSGTLTGTGDADIFYAGGTNDILRGGEGPDTYLFGQTIGHDTIDDVEPPLTADHVTDTIRFATLGHDDVTATRDGLNLILTVNATGETVTVLREFEGRLPSLFGDDLSDDTGVAEIVFADGVVWNQQDIAKAVSHAQSTDDTINGTPSLDWLDGGAGNDHLSGGDDADVYMFASGYGHDVIEENQTNILIDTWDIVRFGAGLTQDNVTFSRTGNSLDLQISINGGDDTLTVVGQFDKSYTLVFAPNWFDQIEFFIFDDGSLVTANQVMEDLVANAKTDGDDTIYGFSVEDVLEGGAGNDFLSGGNENDTYIFGGGYGADIIHDVAFNIIGGMTDTVRFNADVLLEDVTFTRIGSTNDLLITLASGDTLRVNEQFEGFSSGPFGTLWFDRIENFEFTSTSEVLSAEDVIQLILTGAKTPGDDQIYGYFREDVLDGGAGNDYLAGGGEGDTYIWGHGYGNDVVFDQDSGIAEGANIDVIEFAADVSPSDLEVSRPLGTNHLVFTIASTGETLTIQEELDKPAAFVNFNLVEEFRFADATVWTPDEIRVRLLSEAKTSGDDTIVGFYTADRLDGGAGDDLLQGAGGGDTYVWGRGYDHDVIDSYIVYITRDQPDTLEFTSDVLPGDLQLARSGDDLIFTITGTNDQLVIQTQFSGLGYWTIENFEFDNGTSWTWQDVQVQLLAGTGGDDFLNGYDATGDTLDGGAGNDLLIGGGGDDTYVFGRGYDRDTINDDNPSPATEAPDRILFNADTALADLEFVRVGTTDLVIRINGTEDELTIIGQYYSNLEISNFEFTSGPVLSFADVQAIIAQNGPGHVTHRGTMAAETIFGSSVDDVIDGRGGADTLRGGTGSDVYLYGAGSGNDSIAEDGLGSDTDILKLVGLNPADVVISRTGQDLIVTISATGEIMTVIGHFYSAHDGIEQIAFADGPTWDRATILSNAWIRGTSGNDTLNGTFDPDMLDGGPGNDALNGGAGGDTYLYGVGSGNDSIAEGSDSGATDTVRLIGLNPLDVLLNRNAQDLIISINATGETLTVVGHFYGTFNGIEQIVFADSTTWDRTTIFNNAWIRGTSGNDTLSGTFDPDMLDGGPGNDILNGGAESDTYIYGIGSGNDIITENTDSSATDTVRLIGLNSSDILVNRNGQDLILVITATGETLTVAGHFWGPRDGIEQIQFANGTVWDRQTILESFWIRGTSGNDTINGTFDKDTIDGLAGNDTINGGAEGDTYIFGVGSGNDTIGENTDSGATDTLQLVGLNSADVTLTRNGQDLIVAINATGEKVTVVGHYWGPRDGIEQIAFADGTTWDRTTIQTQAWFRGTSGNDTLNGSSEQDTIDGGAGDDTLNGGAESDTYLFGAGSGNDTIGENTDSGATDKVKLVGLNPADVTLGRIGQDLTITINSTAEKITVVGHFWGTRDGIEQIVFADGTTWDRTTILANAWIQGTSGNDTINGTSDPDTIDGGAGNDTLNGGAGSDTYIFRVGSGTDTIGENSDSGATDTVRLVGLNPADMTVGRTGDNLIIIINATGEQVTVLGHFPSTFNGIEQIVFADQTVWNRSIIGQEAPMMGTAGNDSMYGPWADVDEAFLGGLGNDYLEGHGGNDTYIFRLGDGQDTVADWGSSTDVDVLKFGPGILPGNVSVTEVSSNDLRLSIGGTSDSITLGHQLSGIWGGVDQVRFADDTVWDRATLLQKATTATSGNDTYYGDYTANTLSGGAGDDSLRGRDGDDQLSGDTGSDYLEGGAGNDTYLFNLGDGQDRIYDWGNGGDIDTVQFGAGIATGDVTVTLTGGGNDILVGINGTADTVLLDDRVSGSWAGADRVRFDDGTIWDYATLYQMATHHAPTGSLTISGTATDDQTLTANTSSIQDLDGLGTLHYQWQRSSNGGADWSNIGADQATYLLGDIDVGTIVRITVSYTDGFGTAESLTSAATGAVANINDTPVGVNDSKAVNEDAIATGSVLVNDSDADIGDTIRVSNVSNAGGGQPISAGGNANLAGTYGTLTLNSDGSYSYSPNNAAAHDLLPGQAATDVFTYTVADGENATATATLTFNITGIANTFIGTAGDDTLTGTAGPDMLDGQGGNDTLIGGAGADTLIGGTGTDTASYATAPAAVVANLATPASNTGHAAGDTYSGIENLTGSAFNDTLTGDANANTLDGGAGNDSLDGGTGNDVLIGGAGADVLNGNTGIDTASYATAAAGVTANLATPASNAGDAAGDTYTAIENLTGSAFADTLTGNTSANTLDGGAGDDTLIGGAGADVLIGGAGIDTASYATSTAAVTVNMGTPASNAGDAAGDTYNGIENVTGGSAADNITGDANNNTIAGNAGNDTLNGGNGDDILIGGAGGDALTGGAGIDTASYTTAAAAVTANLATPASNTGEAASDTYNTIENLTGSAFNDTLTGNTSANALDGGAGDDTLIGGAGADALIGGAGTDTASYAPSTAAVTANLATPASNTGDAAGDTYSGMENLTGGTVADNLTGDGNNNVISGLAGNDTLNGGDGDDILIGGAGADVLNGGNGTDTASYAAATATVIANLTTPASNTGDAAGDSYTAIENLTGGTGADTLTGNTAANVLDGGSGNDILIGGAGADTLIGGAGTDRASYTTSTLALVASLASAAGNTGDAAGDTYSGIENLTGGSGNDTLTGDAAANAIDGGNGNDTLIGGAGADALTGGAGTDTASYATAAAGVTANLTTPTGNTGEAAGDTYTTIENLTGSAFNDTLTGTTGANVLDGGAGADTLTGGAGADTLIGGAGIDTASYSAATAAVTANLTTGAGTAGDASGDTYSGIENLTGGTVADTLTGDNNANVLTGLAGNDNLSGSGGDDTLIGGAGADVLSGGTGIDTASYSTSTAAVTVNLATPASNTGDASGDTFTAIENVTGGSAADNITGDANANTLSGLAGNDTLNGGNGDDVLIGGAGSDALTGGAGIDTASYATAAAGVTANMTTPSQNTGEAAGDTYNTIENLLGSAFADTLRGDGNANTIEGGAGNDTLTGNAGNDAFVFHAGFGLDTISDFAAGASVGDMIQVDTSLFADFAAIQSHATQVGSNTVITYDAANTITLTAVTMTNLNANDFLFV
jgi:Ca2+-binding RTX toxin-like protein